MPPTPHYNLLELLTSSITRYSVCPQPIFEPSASRRDVTNDKARSSFLSSVIGGTLLDLGSELPHFKVLTLEFRVATLDGSSCLFQAADTPAGVFTDVFLCCIQMTVCVHIGFSAYLFGVSFSVLFKRIYTPCSSQILLYCQSLIV
jgi:hypothetical protein